MTLYVDNSRRRAIINGTSGRWSNLMADTTEELTRAAATLKISTPILEPGTPNERLAINDAARTTALRLGAQKLDAAGVAELLRRKAQAAQDG